MSDFVTLAANAAPMTGLASGTDPAVPVGRIVLAFMFCIVLAIAAIGFIRVRNGMPLLPNGIRWRIGKTLSYAAPSPEKLQIVQRLSVTPNSQLVVLKRGRQNYLLHLTNHGATEIDRFADDQDLPA